MAQLLASKIAVVEEPPRIRSITALPTAVLAAIGITERGPVGTATQVTSFDEFVAIFGSFTANADLTLAMQGFFQNGGTNAWIVRTVHYTDITSAATKTSAAGTITLLTDSGAPSSGVSSGTIATPIAMVDGDTLIVDVNAGGNATATFNATAASRTSGATETFALSDGQTLTVEVDGGSVQTITFNTAEFANIAAATALEVAAVINSEIVGANSGTSAGGVTLTSDRLGTGSGINVTGGTANAVLTFTTGLVSGTGDVSNLAAVTAAEIKTVVEADVAGCTVSDAAGLISVTSNTTGASSSILIDATSTLDTKLGFDNATHSGSSGAAGNTLQVDGKTDGVYANLLSIVIDPATSGDANEFNLLVEDDGLVVETFPNLSMVDANTNFVETVINNANTGSQLIAVTDLDSTAADPTPAEGTFGPLTGGDDGLTSLDDNDFIGSSAGATGLHAFDQTQGLTLLIVPARATSAVHNAMVSYCDTFRDKEIFPILDPPAGLTAAQMVTYQETTAALLNLSEFGAIYWPQIKVLNPNKSIFGDVENITVAPSGHIAGVYSKVDASRPGGVYLAPANVENGVIAGMVGFETNEVLDEKKRDLVYPKRINPITAFPGSPRHIDGSRTLKGNGNFPSIPERRGVIFIESSLKNGLLPFKHLPNTEETRNAADRTVDNFLRAQMRNGAFASTNPDTAYFVDTSTGVNTPSVIASGQMIIRIGLAMAKPAEFIVLMVSQDTRALEEELAS